MGGEGGFPPHFFGAKSYFSCYLERHAKIQNCSQTTSRRKVSRRKKERRIMATTSVSARTTFLFHAMQIESCVDIAKHVKKCCLLQYASFFQRPPGTLDFSRVWRQTNAGEFSRHAVWGGLAINTVWAEIVINI